VHAEIERRGGAAEGRAPASHPGHRFRSSGRATTFPPMPEFDLSSPLLAVATAFTTGFALAILPVGLAEVAAVAIGMVRPPGLALAMLAAFTVAHVAAKVPWYFLGRAADRARTPRVQSFVTRARELVARYPRYGVGILALSAVTSIPPFHLAAIAAGIARIPLGRFVLVCLAGRIVRFGLLGMLPSMARLWLG